MDRQDFLKLTGISQRPVEYLPVAFMTRGGYGCAGYYNAELNRDLRDTCVLLNARLIEFQGTGAAGSRMSIQDFGDCLEQIVQRHYRQDAGLPEELAEIDGKTIPLAAIGFDEVALVYPVAQITALMRRAEESFVDKVPTFLDFRNQSIVVKLLMTKLW